MKTTNWKKMMCATRILVVTGVLLEGGLSRGQTPWPEPVAAPLPDVQGQPVAPLEAVTSKTTSGLAPAAQVGPPWIAIGPASTTGGQVTVPPNNEIAGCIQALAIHPTNPDIIYIAAVNGGVWRTTNGTATSPQWTPLTDGLPSLSMGALEFDPTDPTYQTLVATSARESSLGGAGAARIGVLRTTDGGATWSVFGTSLFANENPTSVAARGTVIMVASDADYTSGFIPSLGSGLFRSTSTGASFTLVSGTSGLPAGPMSDLVGDPGNPSRFFAAVRTVGIFRSDDMGATWINVTSNITGITATTPKVEIAMFNNGATTAVYVAVLSSTNLAGVWRSTNLGATWTQMDTPSTGGQTDVHFAIGTDRTNPALVYVGGQSAGTNSRFRGDASLPLGSQFTSLQSPNSAGTTPHADSREMFCDSLGTLYDAGDGGLYRRPNPSNNTTAWNSANGNLAIFEAHDVAYDAVSDVAMIGTQDNGTHTQVSSANTVWTWTSGGDGGDVAIDDTSTPGQSIRYGSSQSLGGFYRRTYNSSNVQQSSVSPALTVLNSGPAISAQFTTPVELNKVDATRLIIGGSNAAYESLNRGDSVTALTPNSGVGGTYTGKPIAYGGYLNGVPNPDILYYGSGSTVKIRTTAGGAVADTAASFPGGTVNDIVLDRNDYRRVFVCGAASVYYSTNSGGSWTNVTGDLTGVGTTRTIEFFRLFGTDCIAVGTELGVFCSFVNNLGVWQKLGTGLPNAVVFDMKYSVQDSVLVIGTLGRSCFKLPIQSTPLTFLTIDLTTSTVTEGAGPITATLTAVPTPTSNLTVALSSSDTSEAQVPVSVTLLANQSSTTFAVTPQNDTLRDGTQVATLTAVAAGYFDGTASLSVQDDETATLSVAAPPTAIEGAGTVQGTVTMSSPAGKAVTVSLSSSDTTVVTVPATMTIPAGQSSASFPITVVDDGKIDGTQNGTITAHVANWTDGSAPIAVQDNESLNLALVLPATVTEGGTGSGTVSISGTLTTPLTVALSSNTTSRLTVPLTATIVAGSTSATFTLTAPNNTLTDGSAVATITASATGFTGTMATTTVLDNDVHHFAISSIASPQTRGVPFGVTITAQDVNNVTVASFAAVASLSANGSGGPVSITPASTTGFTAGVWTGNVTVNAFGTNVVLSTSDGAGHTGASNPFNVGTGAVDHFAWNPVPATQSVNVPFSNTITAQDAGNNTVTGFTGTVNLSGFVFNPGGATVVITEVNPNTPDEIEFMNVSPSPVNIGGWTIYLYDFDTGGTAPKSFTIPAGTTVAAGQIFRLQESGTAPGTFPIFSYGANINWTSDSTITVGVLLRDDSSNIVDFVCAAGLAASTVTSPTTIPTSQWSGAQIAGPVDLTFGYLRTGNADTNTAANWTTNISSIGTVNTGLTTPFPSSFLAVTISPTVSGNFSGGVWTGNIRVLQAAMQMRLRTNDGASHLGDSNPFDALATIHGNPQTVTVVVNTPKPITLAGQDPANPSAVLAFAIVTPPAHGSLGGAAPNVTYTPTTGYLGADSFTFTVANGPLVSPPAVVTINVTPPPAEITVEQPAGTTLVDGTATVNFGSTSVNGAALSKTFTIRNIGGQPLTISGITGDGADILSFSIPDLTGVTIPAAGTANFTVMFSPTSVGTKTAAIHIGNNDSDENPFDITITGTVLASPEIALEQPAGNDLMDGMSTVSFGDTVLGVPVVKTFTIRNLGVSTLNVTGITSDSADFVAGAASNPSVAPGGSATFNVSFNPSTTGAKSANLRVLSNDLDEGSFDVRLIGIGSAPAGLLRLARDINQTPGSPAITNAAVIGNTVYFAATTAETGTELWKSDGTAVGTVLVRDIAGGTTSSSPANFVVIGSTLYFSATNITNGVELWKSDGTNAGTVLVKDIFTGITSSTPANLTNVAGTLFFSATDSTANGIELWKSDGTTAGTVLVLNINAIANTSSSPANLAAVGSTLFFAANDGINGVELWKSDGTAAGTVPVLDIYAGITSSSPANLTVVGSTLFFSAANSTNGTELWKSDGTAAGTVLVKDIFVGATSSSPTVLINAGGTLFFRANASGQGVELWKSDGTSAGTTLVKDINPGTTSSTPTSLFVSGAGIYFAATDGLNGIELWKSDGTATGTVLVRDINPGAASSSPTNFTQIGSTIYFTATTASGGSELWSTDGLGANTVLVKDINSGTASGAPAVLRNVGGKLVFVANDGANGSELWVSDGTNAGTTLLRDMTPGTSNAAPANLRVLNGALLFSATDGIAGTELWRSDGAPSGTAMVTDINPGTLSSSPGAGVIIGSMLYFAANEPTAGTELWQTDGTAPGTARVKDIFPGTTSSTPANLTRIGNTLYFSASGATADSTELWKSDGTDLGTVLLANINPLANNGSFPANLTDFNGTLFFTANDGTNGTELWMTDGTAAGTVLVKDLNPGSSSSSPANLRVIGNTLFFTATTATEGTELWATDGTPAGTVLVADINPGTISSAPATLTVVGSTLYFSALEPVNGRELWKSDGIAAGAVLVSDINPGTLSSSPANLLNINGTLFFSASDGTTGTELWKSDGGGTVLVRDIFPGLSSSGPTAFANIYGTLYFSAATTGTGSELWKSNGTAAGTVQAADIRPGTLGSGPTNLTVIDSLLFFNATGPDLGTELWVLDLALPDITVEQPIGTPLTDAGSTVNFGNATIGSGGSLTKTFTIRNTAASGTLSGLAVTFDGPAGGNYSVSGLSATSLAPGASASFVVTFSPSATGTRTAALHIASNDPDENPFDIALTGTGVAPTAFEAWRLANFGSIANVGNGANSADFDFDGVLNLFEFGFGTDPTTGASGPGPLIYTGTFAGGGSIVATGQPILKLEPTANGVDVRVLYSRRKDYQAVGLTYTVEFSATLSTWVPATTVPTVLADDGTYQVVSVPYPPFVGGKKARFYRVSITLAP